MAHRTFKVLVTVADFCGLILLTALLLTPARRHPIVNSIVVLSIFHCIIGSLPPFLWVVSPASHTALSALSSHTGWERFCLANAILTNYFTIVKSAFAISFTLPCVYLAGKFTGNRDTLESQARPQFYKRTTIALCVGPFLWGTPLILELAPALAHNPVGLHPQFVGPQCIVVNEAAEIMALVLNLIPLIIAMIASAVLAFILLKYYKLPDLRRSFEILNPIRIARFAALLITMLVSAVLYAIVLTVWLQATRDHGVGVTVTFSLEAWVSIACLWDAVTTLIFFFIFAAHEDVYSVWWQWIRRCLPRCECAPHSYDNTSSTSRGYQKASTLRGPLRIFDWLSHHRARPSDEDEEQCACDSAIALSKGRTSKRWDEAATDIHTPRVLTRHIIQISYAPPFTPSHDLRGLPPPPRHQRSRSHSPNESPVFRAAPSLSAMGPKRPRRAASESRRHPSTRRHFLDHPPAVRPQPLAEDHTDVGKSSWKRLRTTPSDELERSKDEATSKGEEVVTQFSAVSAGETSEYRSRSRAAGGTVEGLDLTGTFGIISPD